MHLKKLGLLGFKSFPDLTEVDFGPGMTGVVGPNGCGKTNILDALRWVLGEQRTSALRSGKMEEVIFNGSRDAKPLGMAEVSLTIANSRGVLPTEYTDLTITRRLYRSGESEYLLNRQPCRLRDILDLFADTGMGAHSYSVIQQDMIDSVLSDKDEERRFLFDEAAGITKYKHRKRAALRKLDATEADLVRLQDIAAEVRTRVNSLKRQSNKARRFNELREQWKELHLRVARSDYEVLQDRVRTQTSRADNLKGDLDNARARVTALEARRDAIQAEVDGQEQTVEDARLRLVEADTQLSTLATERERTRTEQESLGRRREELTQELERLSVRRRELQDRVEELESELKEAEAEAGEAEAQAATLNARRKEAEAAWQSSKDDQARSAASSEEARSHSQQLDSDLSHAEMTLVSLCDALTQSEEALSESESAAERTRRERDVQEGREATAREELTAAEAQLQQVQAELDQARARLKQFEAVSSEAQSARAEIESKLEVLTAWVESYRGYEGAVPDLLTRNRIDGLMDTVAQVIRPESGFERAIAAALGDRVHHLICRDQGSALAAADRLEQSDRGRANMIVLDGLRAPDQAAPAGARSLRTLATAKPEYVALRDYLLSGYYLWEGDGFPNRDTPGIAVWVTTAGRVYRGGSEVAAGRSTAESLLVRKDELTELARQVALQSEAAEKARADVEQTQARCTRLSSDSERLAAELKSARETFQRFSLEAERGRARDDAAQQVLERDRSRCVELRERVSETRSNIERLKTSRQSAQEALTRLRQVSERSESQFESADKARTEAILKSGEAQVHAVSVRGRADGIRSDRDRTQEMYTDVVGRIQTHQEQHAAAEQRQGVLAADLERLAAQRLEQESQRGELDERYRKAREGSRDLLTGLQEIEAELKGARKASDEVAGHHHAAEMAASEARLEVSALCDRVRESQAIELEACGHLEPIDPAERTRVASEAQELRKKLDGMGTVNLLALEEYDEQAERLEFLERQLGDMEEAKKTLLETIQKINDMARSLFAQTFDLVQNNFNDLFSRLFEGGEARVMLENPEDPLESPISIMARPRGKRPVSILQLSGGERALTAIALLFSLYLVKPSPFCILDEIDAPLDDANIGRFLSLLGRFSDNTQFIIITHNKMTMQAVDVLYGVTMERPGISRVVAVKLSEAEEVAGVA